MSRVQSIKRLIGSKPHIYFDGDSWCVCFNNRSTNAALIEEAKQFMFRKNRELYQNGK